MGDLLLMAAAGLIAVPLAALVLAAERWWKDRRPVCGSWQMVRRPGLLLPYRCSRPRRHRGEHVAELENGLLARWPR